MVSEIFPSDIATSSVLKACHIFLIFFAVLTIICIFIHLLLDPIHSKKGRRSVRCSTGEKQTFSVEDYVYQYSVDSLDFPTLLQ